MTQARKEDIFERMLTFIIWMRNEGKFTGDEVEFVRVLIGDAEKYTD